ncbi:MAG: hypothetical protein V3U20_00305, partial [Thermoplasmata archaeon]
MSKYNNIHLKKAMAAYVLIVMVMGNFVFLAMQSQAPVTEQVVESNEVDGGGGGLKVYLGNNQAQCFYASGIYTIIKVSLYVKDEVPNDDSLTVQIYNNDDLGNADPDDDLPGSQLPGASATANGPNNIFSWVDF